MGARADPVWLQVTVKASVPLDVGVDETYALTVPSVCGVAATLSANTQWGALRGAFPPACSYCGFFCPVWRERPPLYLATNVPGLGILEGQTVLSFWPFPMCMPHVKSPYAILL